MKALDPRVMKRPRVFGDEEGAAAYVHALAMLPWPKVFWV